MELTDQVYSNIFAKATVQAFKSLIDVCLEDHGLEPASDKLTEQQAFTLLLASANYDKPVQVGAEAKRVNKAVFKSYDIQNKPGRAYKYCYEMMLKFGHKYKNCFVKVEDKKEESK